MDQSYNLRKPILANQDGKRYIRPIRIDHMTVEMLSTDLRDFCIKSVGVLIKNVFCKGRPHGGARRVQCVKCGSEVLNWHPGSVCAEFGCDRANDAGD